MPQILPTFHGGGVPIVGGLQIGLILSLSWHVLHCGEYGKLPHAWRTEPVHVRSGHRGLLTSFFETCLGQFFFVYSRTYSLHDGCVWLL